jgi:hypothetical protein
MRGSVKGNVWLACLWFWTHRYRQVLSLLYFD